MFESIYFLSVGNMTLMFVIYIISKTIMLVKNLSARRIMQTLLDSTTRICMDRRKENVYFLFYIRVDVSKPYSPGKSPTNLGTHKHITKENK